MKNDKISNFPLMAFKKSREEVNKHVSKMDKIVTGIILWAAVASMLWLARTKKWQEVTQYVRTQGQSKTRRWVSFFGKMLAHFVSIFSKKR